MRRSVQDSQTDRFQPEKLEIKTDFSLFKKCQFSEQKSVETLPGDDVILKGRWKEKRE